MPPKKKNPEVMTFEEWMKAGKPARLGYKWEHPTAKTKAEDKKEKAEAKKAEEKPKKKKKLVVKKKEEGHFEFPKFGGGGVWVEAVPELHHGYHQWGMSGKYFVAPFPSEYAHLHQKFHPIHTAHKEHRQAGGKTVTEMKKDLSKYMTAKPKKTPIHKAMGLHQREGGKSVKEMKKGLKPTAPKKKKKIVVKKK